MDVECKKMSLRRWSVLKQFLQQNGLHPPEAPPELTVNLIHEDMLAATASLEGNVVKYVAVSPEYQGDGLCALLISRLVQEAISLGREHLMLWTKPDKESLFAGTGFYPIERTDQMLLMENRRDGIRRFVESLPRPSQDGVIGAIIANCNPFTNGHLHLVRTAAQQCDMLYFFLVSENRSDFSTTDRLAMARESLSGFSNVVLCPTGMYMISAATFPTYFLKDRTCADALCTELDLKIFTHHIAKPLRITRRFIGEEPLCPLTLFYNQQMQKLLPDWGVQPVVIPRLKYGESVISASRVRELWKQGKMEQLRPLVPDATYRFLCEEKK